MIKRLEDFKTYNLAMDLGEKIWDIVLVWWDFEKQTIGKQFVRAADSIAANLSEGLGRYHYKEAKNFSYYSRGSLYETRTWLKKATNRGLVSESEQRDLDASIETIGKILNGYISSIGGVSEPVTEYGNPNANSNAECLMPSAQYLAARCKI